MTIVIQVKKEKKKKKKARTVALGNTKRLNKTQII
jgi:hypothetical protein